MVLGDLLANLFLKKKPGMTGRIILSLSGENEIDLLSIRANSNARLPVAIATRKRGVIRAISLGKRDLRLPFWPRTLRASSRDH